MLLRQKTTEYPIALIERQHQDDRVPMFLGKMRGFLKWRHSLCTFVQLYIHIHINIQLYIHKQ